MENSLRHRRIKQRVQVMSRKNWLKTNGKWLLLLAVLLGLYGLVGHYDLKAYEVGLQSDMISTCERSYKVIDKDLENTCGNLIDQVQAGNKYEVLSDQGFFWVEAK